MMVLFPLMFLADWREFLSKPYFSEEKKLDNFRLDVVEIARVA